MSVKVLLGDCRQTLKTIADCSIQTCVTSPPYFGLRDYGHEGQMGLEPTPEEFVAELVSVFREVHRVLRDDGTLWMNLGDSYAGSGKGRWADGNSYATGKQATHKGTTEGKLIKAVTPDCKSKDLIGIPWMVAFALRADGWYLRQDIIWHKPNPMPESVTDRCTKAHEYIFLLSKSPQYYFDHKAIQEPAIHAGKTLKYDESKYRDQNGKPKKGYETHVTGNREIKDKRNKRSVWTVTTKPFKGAHFATFPQDLIEPCILAGCPEGGTVLDPFGGSGTTGLVANNLGRNALLCEISQNYVDIMKDRLGIFLETEGV
jgi:DNA modification methylase